MTQRLTLTLRLTNLLALILAPSVLWAATYSFEKNEIKSLSVVGYAGEIIVRSEPKAEKITITATPQGEASAPAGASWTWGPSLRRQAEKAEIRIEGPISKKDWQTVMNTNQFPKYRITVTGPSMPLKAFLREGTIQINDWSAPVDAHVLEGKLVTQGVRGGLKASVQKGKAQISGQKGPTQVSGLDVAADLNDVEGDLQVRSSQGRLSLKNIKGVVTIENDQGSTRVDGLQGAINFVNGSGKMNLAKVTGGIEGQTAEGAVEVQYSGSGEVQINSRSGKVMLRVPNSAAPYVVLTSEEGDLFVPSYFNVRRTSSNKTAKGRVRGKEREGSIKVTSKTADILLR